MSHLLLYSFDWVIDGRRVFQCLNAQAQGVMRLSQVGQSPLLLLQHGDIVREIALAVLKARQTG